MSLARILISMARILILDGFLWLEYNKPPLEQTHVEEMTGLHQHLSC